MENGEADRCCLDTAGVNAGTEASPWIIQATELWVWTPAGTKAIRQNAPKTPPLSNGIESSPEVDEITGQTQAEAFHFWSLGTHDTDQSKEKKKWCSKKKKKSLHRGRK